MTYGHAITLDRPFAETVAAVRDALGAEGFGVLTEIDMAATLQAKLGEHIEPYVVLGACNPPLAHRALLADPSVGLLLPCNVVVRDAGAGRTVVEALDPQVMSRLSDAPGIAEVADDAAARLGRVLDSLRTDGA
jgi:uncharacterized protein (DUF302 family)